MFGDVQDDKVSAFETSELGEKRGLVQLPSSIESFTDLKGTPDTIPLVIRFTKRVSEKFACVK